MPLIKLIAAKLLSFVPLQEPLGTRLFNEISKYSVNVAFEAVLLRKNESREHEVFLSKRLPDQTYPGKWHVPGSIFRPREIEQDVAERLSNKEFGRQIMKYDYCGEVFFSDDFRSYLHRIYLIEIEGEIDEKYGQWWPLENLPQNIFEVHKERIIPMALAQYVKNS